VRATGEEAFEMVVPAMKSAIFIFPKSQNSRLLRTQTSPIKKSIQRIQILRCTTAAYPFDKHLCTHGMVEGQLARKPQNPVRLESAPQLGIPTTTPAAPGSSPAWRCSQLRHCQFCSDALERLTHRGGVDADGASGDGAGLLTSLPKPFFRRERRSRESNSRKLRRWLRVSACIGGQNSPIAIEAAADTERSACSDGAVFPSTQIR